MSRYNNWLRQQPSGSITQTLIGVNVGVYLLQWFSPQLDLLSRFALQPQTIAEQNEWWRLITSAILHAGLTHIAFYMFALWQIGSALEKMVGPSRYLTLYLVSALGGSIASYSLSYAFGYSVGASGAIFGLLTAYIIVGSSMRLNVSSAVMWLVINVAISFTGNIDKWAHFGGGAVGALLAWLFVERRRRGAKFDSLYYAVVTAIGGLLVLAFMLRTQALMS